MPTTSTGRLYLTTPPMPDTLGAWRDIACRRCGVKAGAECIREARYAGLPHFQRVEAVGGDTGALSLEENRRFRESRVTRRR